MNLGTQFAAVKLTLEEPSLSNKKEFYVEVTTASGGLVIVLVSLILVVIAYTSVKKKSNGSGESRAANGNVESGRAVGGSIDRLNSSTETTGLVNSRESKVPFPV